MTLKCPTRLAQTKRPPEQTRRNSWTASASPSTIPPEMRLGRPWASLSQERAFCSGCLISQRRVMGPRNVLGDRMGVGSGSLLWFLAASAKRPEHQIAPAPPARAAWGYSCLGLRPPEPPDQLSRSDGYLRGCLARMMVHDEPLAVLLLVDSAQPHGRSSVDGAVAHRLLPLFARRRPQPGVGNRMVLIDQVRRCHGLRRGDGARGRGKLLAQAEGVVLQGIILNLQSTRRMLSGRCLRNLIFLRPVIQAINYIQSHGPPHLADAVPRRCCSS